MRNTWQFTFKTPLLTLLFLCCCALALQAQTNWTGAINTDWDNPGNWTAGVPDMNDNVRIVDRPNDPVISTAAVAKSIELGIDGLSNNAQLTIVAGGTLTIAGPPQLLNYFKINNGSTLHNNGTINISDALNHVAIRNEGTINNNASGTITFEHTWVSIHSNFGSIFNNYGTVNINLTQGVFPISYGIDGHSLGLFNNYVGGMVNINNTWLPVRSVGFNNYGTLVIGENVTYGILYSNFHNQSCGTVNCSGPLDLGSLTNDGLLFVNTTAPHSGGGTLTNNGILVYPQGNPVPNVINNEIIILPKTNDCPSNFTNVLTLDNPPDFSIASTWYLDEDLTQPAGVYNLATNTFTPNPGFPEGVDQAVYFSITDLANGCTRTASQVLQNGQIITYAITGDGSGVCASDPGPVIGLAGSQVGVSYQLQDGGGMDIGSSLPGTGAPLFFGSYPAGDYQVVATNGVCPKTSTATIHAGNTVNCSVELPDFCNCNDPSGFTAVMIKVNAPEGQNWEVVDVVGLYETQAATQQVAAGAVLGYAGGDMYILTAYRDNSKGYYIRVSNGYTVQDVRVGNPAW